MLDMVQSYLTVNIMKMLTNPFLMRQKVFSDNPRSFRLSSKKR
jgi:hypothetical protein